MQLLRPIIQSLEKSNSLNGSRMIHNMASVGNFEQEHTSVLNLILQHVSVCGGDLKSLLANPMIRKISLLHRVEWISGRRTSQIFRIWHRAFSFITTFRCRLPRTGSLWNSSWIWMVRRCGFRCIGWRRMCRWTCKKVSRCKRRIPNVRRHNFGAAQQLSSIILGKK